MITYKQWEVVLVEFGFSEGMGSKKRPALIISSHPYHTSRQEVIVAAITSNVQRILFGDTKIERWKSAGLLYPSLATGIIRTIKGSLIIRKIGILETPDAQKIHAHLRQMLGF